MKTRSRPAERRAARTQARTPRAPRKAGLRPGSALTHPSLWGALAALLVYLPTLAHGFVWDDHHLIEQNPLLRTGAGLAQLLATDFWSIAGTRSGFWRPLVTLSYAIDGRLGHWQPALFHLTNLSLHALAAAVLGAILLQAGPAHVESVAWIAGRTDVLCGVLLALAYLLDRRARARGRSWPGAAACLAFALALLAKEAAALGLLVLAIAERVERRPWRGAARWLAPYAALTAVWLVLHLAIAREGALPPEVGALAQARGRWGAWTMMAGDLRFLLPWGTHSPQMALRLPERLLAPEVILGGLLTLALGAALGVLVSRRARAAIPLGWFLLTLAPPVALMLVRVFLVYGERLLYVPSFGAAWLLALVLAPATRSGPARAVALALAAAWIVASAVVTVRLLPPWADDFDLFRAMARAQPRNAAAHVTYAFELLRRGRDDEAAAEIARADSLEPGRARVHHARGLLAMRHGDWTKVIAESDRALALDPGLLQARMLRATALLRSGQVAAAGEEIARLRSSAPNDPQVGSLEGQWQLMRGEYAEAQPRLEAATRWVRDDADLWYALGMADARLQRVPEARDAFAQAVRVEPDFYEGWLRLATACHLLGDVAGRDGALARAAALPDAADGRAAMLARRFAGGAR